MANGPFWYDGNDGADCDWFAGMNGWVNRSGCELD